MNTTPKISRYASATRILTSAWRRITSRSKKALQRMRETAVTVERESNEQEKYLRMLRGLNMVRLAARHKREKKAAKRLNRLLLSTPEDSPLRKPLQDEITRLTYCVEWIRQEADRRTSGE